MTREQMQRRTTALLGALLCLAVGCGGIAFGLHALSLQRQLAADGIVTTGHVQTLSYEYEVAGKRYTDLGPQTERPGSEIAVRYSRSNPSLSRPGDADFGHFPALLAGGALVGVSLLLFSAALRSAAEPASSEQQQEELILVVEQASQGEPEPCERAA